LPHGVEVGDSSAPFIPLATSADEVIPDFWVSLPEGTVIVDRSCWQLCCWQFGNDPPYAEPADDECAALVDADTKARPDAMERIYELSKNANKHTAFGRHITRLAVTYGLIGREELEIN
jgi:hypothetical protein